MGHRVDNPPPGRPVRRRASAAALAVGLWLAGAAAGRGDEIDLAKVPAAVRGAADKAVPKADWTSASKETDDGKEFWYELEGTDAKGRYVHATVAADGKVNEVSTEVPFKDAPGAVTAALAAKLSGFKPATTHEIRTDGKVERYDLEGADAKGRAVYVSVSPGGELDEVFTEVKPADVPKAAAAALAAKFPRFTAATVYEVRAGGKVERYDFEGKRPRDKEEITVSVTPDGKSVEVDE